MKKLMVLVAFLVTVSFAYDVFARSGVSASTVKQNIASSSPTSPASPSPTSTPVPTSTPPTPTPTPTPTDTPTPTSASTSAPVSRGQYKDGSYTGDTEDAFYGNVQVQVVVSGGKLTDVKFLQYPDSHSTSVFINQQAMPMLKQEALQAQSASVDGVSGASATSQAFQQSLSTALSQATNS